MLNTLQELSCRLSHLTWAAFCQAYAPSSICFRLDVLDPLRKAHTGLFTPLHLWRLNFSCPLNVKLYPFKLQCRTSPRGVTRMFHFKRFVNIMDTLLCKTVTHYGPCSELSYENIAGRLYQNHAHQYSDLRCDSDVTYLAYDRVV